MKSNIGNYALHASGTGAAMIAPRSLNEGDGIWMAEAMKTKEVDAGE